jgi:hypothetical protein
MQAFTHSIVIEAGGIGNPSVLYMFSVQKCMYFKGRKSHFISCPAFSATLSVRFLSLLL